MSEEPMEEKQVVIYTDGACDGNPGPGGYGVVMLYEGSSREVSQGYRLTTNNRMEVLAAISGLEALKERSKVTVFSDSKYLVDAINQGWAVGWMEAGWVRKDGKRVLNADLWMRLLSLIEEHNVTFKWVKGHSGDGNNERADTLSYAAIENRDLLEDEGYKLHLEVEKAAPSKITKEGQPCRKCETPVVKKLPKRKLKPRQSFYFEYYLFCPGCQTRYMVEEAKRFIDQASLFNG
jgi:ribonuclease HI